MKTLSTCADVEFLRQTNKIRKYAEKWLNDTGIKEIRKQEAPKPDESMSDEEKQAFYRKVARDRLSAMLDAALDTHAEQTAGLLRLLCFVEPDDDKTLRMSVLLRAATEMLEDQNVLDFFTTLGRLGLMNT